MTCYLHIGTMKTGTSSIQNFLYLNRELLKKQNYYYPLSIKNIERLNDHNPFAHKLNYLIANNIKIDNIINYFFKELKSEIGLNNLSNFIISTENIQWLFYSYKAILKLKKILNIFGFNKIYIVIYLREVDKLFLSMCSQAIKDNTHNDYHLLTPEYNNKSFILSNYKNILNIWRNIFDNKNLIVRLFDKNEFYQGDLLKDFVHSIGLEWDNDFIIPKKENESLNLLGIELLNRINKYNLFMYKSRYFDIVEYFDKHFTSKDENLKFKPKKEIIQSYIDYFEESNEWVRKEFFPHKQSLFPKKDLTTYKENYELKEMKPEYWDKIAEFVADIVKTKNEIIINKEKTIQNQTNLIQEKDITIQSKNTQINQLTFQTKYSTAKARIQSQLSYKLGQTMIINSKSILGIISMPIYLLSTLISYKQEQKIYQEKIKKDPSLILPPLQNYPDFQEALKEKQCLTYKLGQALIKASNNWYGGGYIKLWFEIRKLKKKFIKKKEF